MPGRIVTFYSYKGGVGRSFALANTAVTLARWGYRVLCVDWDLDAPGLSYYLRKWMSAPVTTGLVDFITDITASSYSRPAEYVDPDGYVVPVPVPDTGDRLYLLPAGGGWNSDYVDRVQRLDWAVLYDRHDLGGMLESCRDQWRRDYDVVLVDSRTGITDIGGICTGQLPDVLVMLFTANEQSLAGTLDVARRARAAQSGLPYDRSGLMIVPVPSRFDAREEYERATEWQERFTRDLAPLVSNWASRELPVDRLVEQITIPYVSYWSFGEDLPAEVETEPGPSKIGYSLETLAALLAHRLERTGLLAQSRDSFVGAAALAGRRTDEAYDVFLSTPADGSDLPSRLVAEMRARSLRVAWPVFASSEAPDPAVLSAGHDEMVAASSSLVVLLGDEFGSEQARGVDRFLRQTLDAGTGRPVIPVLAPGAGSRSLPGVLSSFRAERIADDTDAALRLLAQRIAAAVLPQDGDTPFDDVRWDALDVLSEAATWTLDERRWLMVGDTLEVLDQALADTDPDRMRAAVTDLELLGPVRASSVGRTVVAMPDTLRNRVGALITRLADEVVQTSAGRAVADRVRRFDDGDESAVLGPAALRDATRYRGASAPDDVDAHFTLGTFHLRRSAAERDGAADRARAVGDLAVVFGYVPDRVPDALRAEVEATLDAGPTETARWRTRLTAMLATAANDPAGLGDVVWLARLVLRHLSADAPDRVDVLLDLARALRLRFVAGQTGAGSDAALAAARDAVNAATDAAETMLRVHDVNGGPDLTAAQERRATAMALLGSVHVERHRRTADPAEITAAVDDLAQAVGLAAVDGPLMVDLLLQLGAAQVQRFRQLGDAGDLEAAVECYDNADNLGDRSAALAAATTTALTLRFEDAGDPWNLNSAIETARRAAAALAPDDTGRADVLVALARALSVRFEHARSADDLDAGILALDEARLALPAGPARTALTLELSTMTRARFDVRGHGRDIHQAVALAEEATEAAVDDDTLRTRCGVQLAVALAEQARHTGEAAEAEDAAQWAQVVVAGHPEDSPEDVADLADLGFALSVGYARTAVPDLLTAAADAYRTAAELAVGVPLWRAAAARGWGDAARAAGDHRGALVAYSTALDQLGAVPYRARPGLAASRFGARLDALGSEAAAAALELGDPLQALGLLEQGRRLLVTRAFGLDDLAGFPDPELRHRVGVLRRRLHDPATPRRRRLLAEWRDLVDEIRTHPGWRSFLSTPGPDELDPYVVGPLVAVNVADTRCDAIIVRSGTVDVLPLDRLTRSSARLWANHLLGAVHGDDPDRDAMVSETLGRMWDAVAAPVLDELKLSTPDEQGSDLPRLWWLPTGALGVLPLAAATATDGSSVLDRVVSSTALTLRSFRSEQGADESDGLIVSVPAELAHPTAESLWRVIGGDSGSVGTLDGPAAIRPEVIPRLAGSLLTHFACDAHADLARPDRAGLTLADGSLTVRDLADATGGHGRFAYLSACRTDLGGRPLPDEPLHIAPATQAAAFENVVATMWPLGDLAARRVVRMIYDELAEDASEVAVHRVARELRAQQPGRPTVWAAPMHCGR